MGHRREEEPKGDGSSTENLIKQGPEELEQSPKTVEDLERQVEELTTSNEALKNQLEEKEKRIKRLENKVEELMEDIHTIVHDIKSKVASIPRTVEMITERYGSSFKPVDKRMLELTQVGAKWAYNFADRLLETATNKPVMVEAIDLNELFKNEVIKSFPELSEKGIELSIPEEGAKINADRTSMVRAFSVLIENATKYGGSNLSEIAVELSEGQDEYVISVRDNGAGIKQKDIGKIFRPSYRGSHEDQRVKKEKGYGLGLAGLKKIAQRHGGKAWVESKEGEGATFYVSISKNLKEKEDERKKGTNKES